MNALQVTVIGCDGRPLPPEATGALDEAVRVAGAPRHLDAADSDLPASAERITIKRLDDAIDAILGGPGPVAVLASGDPGFFGIVRALRARGKLAAALAHPKVAILTGPGESGPAPLGRELVSAGGKAFVAERLGSDSERVTELAGAADDFSEPNVLVALDPAAPSSTRWLAGHPGAPERWALPESSFEHRDSAFTKSEVRALVLSRLGPGPGRIIWDVGAGSGSVAVECARFGAWVIAVDSDREQCAMIRRNAARHGVYLRVREGRAPAVLDGLPAPDAIFAADGGDPPGGEDALGAAVRLGRPERVVAACTSVDRVAAIRDLLAGLGYEPEGTQLQANRLAVLPNGSVRLEADGPVFVLWGDRRE